MLLHRNPDDAGHRGEQGHHANNWAQPCARYCREFAVLDAVCGKHVIYNNVESTS